MKIAKIEIQNFRSIREYSFDLADFNVFVGQNNHGKTNLFDALSWFDSGKTDRADIFMHEEGSVALIRVHYSGVQAALDLLQNEEYKAALKNKIQDFDEIAVEKTSVDNKRSIIVDGINIGNPRGFDSALNYFLPKIEYVTTKVRLNEVSGYKSKSPIAEMLGSVLSDVIEHDPKYKDFIRLFDEIFNSSTSIFRDAVKTLEGKVEFYLEKQFAEGAKVDFKISDPAIEDMLKGFETFVNDGIRTRAEEKGDGMKRAIMLAIIQSYADYRKEKGLINSFIFLIDEAELHLHPSAQRALKRALRDIIESHGQVLINTHSSIFANESFESQKLFSVKKVAGESGIQEIITEQQRLDSIYQLLGGSPSDLLLPNNFIIVEGPSECKFLERIIDRFYFDNKKLSGTKVLFARGDHERARNVYDCIHEAYLPLQTNGIYKNIIVIILDKPHLSKEASFAEFKEAYPHLQEGTNIHVLSEDALEKYYPDGFKKNDAEIKVMDEARQKVNYAIEVAEKISLEQFRDQMPVMFSALEQASVMAYE